MSRPPARPRFETPPTKGSRLDQRVLLGAARALGFTPMPWQRKAIRLLGELRDPTDEEVDQLGPGILKTGIPRYRQVIVTVPRQSGKSTIAKAFVIAGAEARRAQNLYGTSKTRDDAREWQAELASNLGAAVDYTKGAGRETIAWPNRSTYQIFAPNRKGGHGATAWRVLLDEAWTITSDVMQGIVPAMSAVPESQLLMATSMGTIDSTTWIGLYTAGRDAAHTPGSSMAYIEYSAHEGDEDRPEWVFDESKWHLWMPALGHTITRESVRADMALMMADPEEGLMGVIRAYGNLTTTAVVNLFPNEWVTDAWRVIEPPARFVLTLDVNNDPAGATVATGHMTSEGPAARVVEWRYGPPRWVPDKVAELARSREVEAVVADFGGPARSIRAEIQAICEAERIPLIDRMPMDFAGDCGRFMTALQDGQVVLEKSEILVESLTGARSKTISDRGLWLVSRGLMAVDASPIISIILAFATAAELDVQPRVDFYIG